jgi:hypothetical protein
MKRKYLVTIFPFFQNKITKFQGKRFEIFSPDLDSDLSLVACFKPVFIIFRHVINLKNYHHLILDPSWDASERHNIRRFY